MSEGSTYCECGKRDDDWFFCINPVCAKHKQPAAKPSVDISPDTCWRVAYQIQHLPAAGLADPRTRRDFADTVLALRAGLSEAEANGYARGLREAAAILNENVCDLNKGQLIPVNIAMIGHRDIVRGAFADAILALIPKEPSP